MTNGNDSSLGTRAGALREVAKDARAWVRKVAEYSQRVGRESGALVERTLHSENLARKVHGSASRRPCVGVFGPSQAAKSYLVESLGRGSDRGKPLEVEFAGKRVDYLKEINPQGQGKEATGLVTRFTTARGLQEVGDLPVHLRLLTETDLVKILGNAFLSDFDNRTRQVKLLERDEELVAAIERARGCPKVAVAHLDEILMFDIGEYFKGRFRNNVKDLTKHKYWECLTEVGHQLSLGDRAELYSLLWGRHEAFTALFRYLIGKLESLGHAQSARSVRDAIAPASRDASIINVELLMNGLCRPEGERDTVKVAPVRASGAGGPTCEVPRAALAALVAEIELFVPTCPWPFLEHTDLLDFPGARSRLKEVSLPSDEEALRLKLNEMLLRGKVAYLFERCVEDHDLSTMLLCIPPGNQEVKDLPDFVETWITKTLGGQHEQRSRLAGNPLLFVMTKFDLTLDSTPGDTPESIRQKVESRFKVSMLEPFQAKEAGWLENWDGGPFRNVYFLRNPEFRSGIFGSAQEVVAGALTGRGELAAYVQSMRSGMMESAVCRKHLVSPETAFDAVFGSDGGIGHLVRGLQEVASPGLKQAQLAEQVGMTAKALEAAFDEFAPHVDGDAEKRKKELEALRIRLKKAVEGPDKSYGQFFDLLRLLSIDPAEARATFLDESASSSDADPAAASSPAAEDDPWAESSDESPPVALSVQVDRWDKLARRVVGRWTKGIRDGCPSGAVAIGLDEKDLNKLVDVVLVAADRSGVEGEIARRTRDLASVVTARREVLADRAGGIAATIINDFVASLGFDKLPPQERPRRPARAEPIFHHPPMPQGLKDLDLGEDLTAKARGTERFIDWGVGFLKVGIGNIGHEGGHGIQEQDRERLQQLLKSLRSKVQAPVA